MLVLPVASGPALGPCSPTPFSATGTSAHMETTNQRQTPGPFICRGRCWSFSRALPQCSCNSAALSWRGPGRSAGLLVLGISFLSCRSKFTWEPFPGRSCAVLFPPGGDQRAHPSCPLVLSSECPRPGYMGRLLRMGCSLLCWLFPFSAPTTAGSDQLMYQPGGGGLACKQRVLFSLSTRGLESASPPGLPGFLARRASAEPHSTGGPGGEERVIIEHPIEV